MSNSSQPSEDVLDLPREGEDDPIEWDDMLDETQDEHFSALWIDPGVTTGWCLFHRRQTGKEEVHYGEVSGLEATLRQIENAIGSLSFTNRTVGYESFYIATRSTKTSEHNIRGATHVIGWLEGQHALDRLR